MTWMIASNFIILDSFILAMILVIELSDPLSQIFRLLILLFFWILYMFIININWFTLFVTIRVRAFIIFKIFIVLILITYLITFNKLFLIHGWQKFKIKLYLFKFMNKLLQSSFLGKKFEICSGKIW